MPTAIINANDCAYFRLNPAPERYGYTTRRETRPGGIQPMAKLDELHLHRRAPQATSIRPSERQQRGTVKAARSVSFTRCPRNVTPTCWPPTPTPHR